GAATSRIRATRCGGPHRPTRCRARRPTCGPRSGTSGRRSRLDPQCGRIGGELPAVGEPAHPHRLALGRVVDVLLSRELPVTRVLEHGDAPEAVLRVATLGIGEHLPWEVDDAVAFDDVPL